MLDPLLKFCELHHDKLIRGDNTYGPAGVGKNCKAFLWSKIKRPFYYYPRPFDPPGIKDGPDELTTRHLELRRTSGKANGGYYLYILENSKD